MVELKPKIVSADNFEPYGQLIKTPDDRPPTVENEQVTFWKQQANYLIDGDTEIGVLKVRKHNMDFNELENHFKTPTILICLDGSYILPVALPSNEVPEIESVKAFIVPKGQSVVLAEKCWHGATYPIDQEEITLLVIFKKGSLENDTVFKPLNGNCRII